MTTNDYLYENAPLVEVIAEVRWAYTKLPSIPNGGIDPQYEQFAKDFASAVEKLGYTFREPLVPDEIPREFLAGQPMLRLRKGANQWPLFQVGQGLLTANVVPPYKGWAEYRTILRTALLTLYSSYPSAEQLLRFERLDLRYLDAFTAKHGLYEPYGKASSECVRIGVTIPDKLKEFVAGGTFDNVTPVVQLSFNHKSMSETSGEIKFGPGMTAPDNAKALIAEFRIFKSIPSKYEDSEKILGWFDDAHREIREWFEATISDKTRDTFGKRSPIN